MDALADPVRRRVLELVATGERSAGQLAEAVAEEFGITQPATSRHLRVLRESGLVRVRAERSRRLYVLDPTGLKGIEEWLGDLRALWMSALASLETEVARGLREADRPLEGDS